MNHVPSMLAQFLWNFIIAYVLTPIIYVVIFPFWVCYFVYDLFTRKHVPAPEGILITGASSGIGEGLAYYYAQHSAKVLYLFGQNEERLNNTKENCLKYNPELSVFTYQGDITDEKVFNERIQSIVQKNNVDLVIANAGRLMFPEMTSQSLMEDVDKVFNLNILACCHTILPFVDQMKERGAGQLAVIGSINGYGNLFAIPTYESSKNCVRVYFEILQQKLMPYNIHVNIVAPGPVATRFSKSQDGYPLCYTPDEAAKYIAEQLSIDTPYISFPALYHILFYTVGRQIPNFFMYYVKKYGKKRNLKA